MHFTYHIGISHWLFKNQPLYSWVFDLCRKRKQHIESLDSMKFWLPV